MKVEDFDPFTLGAGPHDNPSSGMCVMEMVSFLAGEEWSDMPVCSSPVIARFCQMVNDCMGQDSRDRLKNYAPRLIGTVSPEHEQERVEYLAWQAVTVFVPIALDAAGWPDEAKALRDFDRSKGLAAAAADAADAAATVAVYAADAAARADAFAARAAAFADRVAAFADRVAVYAADAAFAAADADADAAFAAADADADAAAADAIFDTLDGLLAIGPSGAVAYTEEQLARLSVLRDAVTA